MTRTALAVLLATFPLSACFCDQPVGPGGEPDDAGELGDEDAGGDDAGDAPGLDAGLDAALDAGIDAGPCANAITGDVTITDEAELAALAGVQCIFGSLLIPATALTNLDGLEALLLVSGDVEITGNGSLLHVDGLSALEEIGGSLSVNDNVLQASLELPSLLSIGGDLGVEGIVITDLDGLSSLETIGGRLQLLNNDDLTSITGLAGVVELGGLNIEANAALSTFAGLENIAPVLTGDLRIGLNNEPADYSAIAHLTAVQGLLRLIFVPVTDLAFLANLDTVGELRLERLDGLTTLDDLQSVTSLGALLLQQNAALTTLGAGLEQVTTVDGDLRVINCPLLTDLTALDALTGVGGDFALERTAVPDVDPFLLLTDVGGDFDIADDDQLTNLAGFDNLATVGGTFFRIADNLSLPQNLAQALLDRIVLAGGYDDGAGTEIIANNGG